MYSDLERPPLDAKFLTGRLVRPGSVWTAIEVLPETGSTNVVVAERARAGGSEGLVVATELQTAGKGRMGRTWAAPAGSSLLFSVLLRPATVSVERWPWLGLLTPLAVATAVRDVADVPAELKWPNDVLVEERKLAGILLERVDTPDGPAVVAGVGLNVTLREAERPHPAATSLALERAATTDRVTVLAAVLRELERRYSAWTAASGDPSTVLPAYRELSATLGRKVRAELPGGTTLTGTATDLDPEGRLILTDSDGKAHPLAAGDVIHLR
jgi:BirA family biotin operon repressor/biotin-[acetyl-CoA-carboxylase] ligase